MQTPKPNRKSTQNYGAFLKWSTIPGHRAYSKLWQIHPLEKIGVLGQR